MSDENNATNQINFYNNEELFNNNEHVFYFFDEDGNQQYYTTQVNESQMQKYNEYNEKTLSSLVNDNKRITINYNNVNNSNNQIINNNELQQEDWIDNYEKNFLNVDENDIDVFSNTNNSINQYQNLQTQFDNEVYGTEINYINNQLNDQQISDQFYELHTSKNENFDKLNNEDTYQLVYDKDGVFKYLYAPPNVNLAHETSGKPIFDEIFEQDLYTKKNFSNEAISNNYRISKRSATTKICEFCGLFLRHPSKIAAHMRTHTGERPFTCEYCGQDFSQRTPYRMHVKRHVGDLPFNCSFCEKKFPSNASRNGHEIRVHHRLKREGQPKPHLKPAQNFIEKRDVQNTKNRLPVLDWRSSDLCTNITNNQMQRISNIVEFVAAGLHKNIVSPTTVLSSPTMSSYPQPLKNRRHEDRHPPTVAQCTDCGLIFKHPSKIQAHMRTHTGEKPFVCNVCNLGCSTNSALRVHIRRFHTGERPHECTWDCGRRFVSVAARNEHERIVHVGIKRYQCTIGDCRRLFTRRIYMIKHLQTHSIESNNKVTAFRRLQRYENQQKVKIDLNTKDNVNNCIIYNYNNPNVNEINEKKKVFFNYANKQQQKQQVFQNNSNNFIKTDFVPLTIYNSIVDTEEQYFSNSELSNDLMQSKDNLIEEDLNSLNQLKEEYYDDRITTINDSVAYEQFNEHL